MTSNSNEPVEFGLKKEKIMPKLADEIFDLDTAVESILNALEGDIKHSIENDKIPSSAGQIEIYIDKREDGYELSMKSNGTGVEREDLKNYISVVGKSSLGGQESAGVWILAPFCFNPESYKLSSNTRKSDECISAVSTPEGFNILVEDQEYDFIGTKVELKINTTEYTIPDIGSKIRGSASSNIEVPVIYEVRDNGTVKEQTHINFD